MNYLGHTPSLDNKDVGYINTHSAFRFVELSDIATKYKNFVVAAFVRNPFDRLVSFWAHKINTGVCNRANYTKYGFIQHMDFDDALKIILRNPYANIHFAPQVSLLMHGNKLLPNFLGKYENLTSDWKSLVKIASIKLPSLERLNAYQHESYRHYYDANSIDRVSRIYAEDLKTFGYEF